MKLIVNESESKVEKLIRDGMVAVIYSPGFGGGWSTWNPDYPEILFDPVLASYVEDNKLDEAYTYITMRWPDVYTGGVDDLSVQWLPVGTKFRIHEYDGSESIEIKERIEWITA